MSGAYPGLLSYVDINAGNKAVRVTINGVTSTLNLVEGTYLVRGDGSADDLLAAFIVMLNSHADADAFQIETLFQVHPEDANIINSISLASGTHQFSLLFANGATTFDASLLGFPQSDIASGAGLVIISTLSSSAVWIGNSQVRRFDPVSSWMRKRSRALSGVVRAVNRRSEMRDRQWIQEHVHEKRFNEEAITTDPNRAFNRFLQRSADGTPFEFHDIAPAFVDSGGQVLFSNGFTLQDTFIFDDDFYPTNGELGARGNGVPLFSFNGHLLPYVP